MGKILPLVVLSESRNGHNYKIHTTPVVRYLNDEFIHFEPPQAVNGVSVVTEIRHGLRYDYKTPIKPDDLEVLRNPATTDYALTGRRQVAQSANGTTNATTLTLKQYNEITVITAASAEACKLPVDPTVNDTICVINNDAADTLKVFPGVGDFINALAVNTAYDVLPGKRVFFVCLVANIWTTAVDTGR